MKTVHNNLRKEIRIFNDLHQMVHHCNCVRYLGYFQFFCDYKNYYILR